MNLYTVIFNDDSFTRVVAETPVKAGIEALALSTRENGELKQVKTIGNCNTGDQYVFTAPKAARKKEPIARVLERQGVTPLFELDDFGPASVKTHQPG